MLYAFLTSALNGTQNTLCAVLYSKNIDVVEAPCFTLVLAPSQVLTW